MIDFHCHLDLYQDPREVASGVQRRSMGLLSVTTTPSAWHGTLELAAEFPNVRTALGFHPELARERMRELARFDALLSETRFVGEVGLDGSRVPRVSWDSQEKVFDHVLAACAEAGDKILTVHSRRAATPVLDRIERRSDVGRVILHWFSGALKDVDRAVGLGCWFGISPAMLATANGRAIVGRIPRERVLLETDGPFGTISGALPMPWDILSTTDLLAKTWEVSPSEVVRIVERNEACVSR